MAADLRAPSYKARQDRRRRTHQRIIDVAADLFYKQGIQQVSVDDVARAADVTKATLYQHFESKDQLISACLSDVDLRHFDWFTEQARRHAATGMPALSTAFAALDQWINSPVFRGCAFINASIQLPTRQHPGQLAVLSHKQRSRDWLASLARDDGFGQQAAREVACHLMILLEGAIVTALVEGDTTAGRQAGEAAELVVAAHRARQDQA